MVTPKSDIKPYKSQTSTEAMISVSALRSEKKSTAKRRFSFDDLTKASDVNPVVIGYDASHMICTGISAIDEK